MANVPMKSLKLPGLSDLYTFLQNDTNLAVTGKAADAKKTGDALAPEYNGNSTYAVGEYVRYNGVVYKCKTDISTAEAWTAAHWTATNVAGGLHADVTDVKSAISKRPEHIFINVEKVVSDNFAIIYFGGSNNIGIDGDCIGFNGRIIHPSGATSSSANGVGALISATFTDNTSQNLLVNGNLFTQDHSSAHTMELEFNIIALPYRIAGYIDYYCDGKFIGRYDVYIGTEKEIKRIYAVGGYFNTGSAVERRYKINGDLCLAPIVTLVPEGE